MCVSSFVIKISPCFIYTVINVLKWYDGDLKMLSQINVYNTSAEKLSKLSDFTEL